MDAGDYKYQIGASEPRLGIGHRPARQAAMHVIAGKDLALVRGVLLGLVSES